MHRQFGIRRIRQHPLHPPPPTGGFSRRGIAGIAGVMDVVLATIPLAVVVVAWLLTVD